MTIVEMNVSFLPTLFTASAGAARLTGAKCSLDVKLKCRQYGQGLEGRYVLPSGRPEEMLHFDV